MKRFMRKQTILFATAFTLVLAIHGVAAAPDFPNPVLAFTGQEHVESGGKQMIRYNYHVANKDKYPDELFAPAPNPPRQSLPTDVDGSDAFRPHLRSMTSPNVFEFGPG